MTRPPITLRNVLGRRSKHTCRGDTPSGAMPPNWESPEMRGHICAIWRHGQRLLQSSTPTTNLPRGTCSRCWRIAAPLDQSAQRCSCSFASCWMRSSTAAMAEAWLTGRRGLNRRSAHSASCRGRDVHGRRRARPQERLLQRHRCRTRRSRPPHRHPADEGSAAHEPRGAPGAVSRCS